MYAFREIRKLERGDYKWSKVLGAWVGTVASAAMGVPERFLNPDKKIEKAEAPENALQEEEAERQEDSFAAAPEADGNANAEKSQILTQTITDETSQASQPAVQPETHQATVATS